MLSVDASGPAGFSDVREANLGVVFRTIRESAPCSRADVANATRLNKATISSLVTELIERGLVREAGHNPERRIGRPGVLLTLDERHVAALGLEVNVDYLTVVALNLLEGEILSWHEPFEAINAGPEACARRLADLARAALADPRLAGRTILGVTAAVPGLIDAPTGVVTDAPNLGWRDFPLRDRLGALLNQDRDGTQGRAIAVHVDNDANLGAIAEYRGGHRAHTPDLVYLTGEVGIGAGVIIAGTLLRGATGFGGEIGHIPLHPDGPRCGCGRHGCLEALAGIQAILRDAAPDLLPADGAAGAGADLPAVVDTVAERALAGDRTARDALDGAGTWLGRGVATVINLLNPRAFLLGGYFVSLAPWLLPSCTAEVAARVIAPDRGGCVVEVSTLGLAAAARGGAAALIDALDHGRLPLPAPTPS